MSATYPANFPCPQLLPYDWAVNMGVLRTPMDSGHARQRRLFRTMPHVFQFEFMVPVALLGQWQVWVNDFAYDFFLMDGQSMWSSLLGVAVSPHSVRFVTDLEFNQVSRAYVRARVAAELDPRQQAISNPVIPSFQWIVAGTPQAPSIDGVVAGTPAAPALDRIIAGTPTAPVAVV